MRKANQPLESAQLAVSLLASGMLLPEHPFDLQPHGNVGLASFQSPCGGPGNIWADLVKGSKSPRVAQERRLIQEIASPPVQSARQNI